MNYLNEELRKWEVYRPKKLISFREKDPTRRHRCKNETEKPDT